jgi:hypothetical protein
MGEINKEALNRLKKLKNEQEKINEDITYCVSQIELATSRIATAQNRNDYPLILAMATEMANQNTKLQSATQNIIAIRGDIQHLLANNPEIKKAEEETKKRGYPYRGGMMGGYDIPRRATKRSAGVNRVTKPAKKKCAAPPAGKKRAGTRR